MSDNDTQKFIFEALKSLSEAQSSWVSEARKVNEENSSRLIRLEVGQEQIIQHLAKLNGKVAEHEAKLTQAQMDLVTHKFRCPLGTRVEKIDSRVSKLEAAKIKTQGITAGASLVAKGVWLVLTVIASAITAIFMR